MKGEEKQICEIIGYVLNKIGYYKKRFKHTAEINTLIKLIYKLSSENDELKKGQSEDSVVISREKLHEIEENSYQVGVALGKKIGGKETAERDFHVIVKTLEESKERVKAVYGISESVGADIAVRTVKELAKQYGVEIKE